MMRATPYITALALLAGCGWLAAGALQGGQAAPAGGQLRNVSQLLDRLDSSLANLQDYSVTGVTDTNGKQQRFTLTFKRPNLVRIDTRDGQVAVQPNGDIKGRLGHGPLGRVAQKLDRRDKRLRDAEGIPFYESDFVSVLARIRAQIRAGATATMATEPTVYVLGVGSGDAVWRYRVDRSAFSILQSSRSVRGEQVEITHFTQFRPNTGVTEQFFRF